MAELENYFYHAVIAFGVYMMKVRPFINQVLDVWRLKKQIKALEEETMLHLKYIELRMMLSVLESEGISFVPPPPLKPIDPVLAKSPWHTAIT